TISALDSSTRAGRSAKPSMTGRRASPSPISRICVATGRTNTIWRPTESRLTALAQFRTVIDGLGIHFLHLRSPHAGALPLVVTHGWPGSIVAFLEVIGPLTDPPAHGGDAADAVHLVCPSLPGYGFSDKPATPGWGVERPPPHGQP